MKYSAKFYLEKRKEIVENVPVMLSVTFNSKQMFYYTGKRCDVKQWAAVDKDKLKKSVEDCDHLKRNQITSDGQTSTDFNSDLLYIKRAVHELFKAYDVAGEVPTPTQLRDNLKLKLGKTVKVKYTESFFDQFEQYLADSELSQGSKISYGTVKNHLKNFKPAVTFENFNPKDFKQYLIDEKETVHNGKKRVIKGKGSNTVNYYLRLLKIFFDSSLKKKHTAAKPFESFEIPEGHYGNPIYINVAERDLLFNATFTDVKMSKTTALSRSEVRDIFLLQCFIGCRIGDLRRMTHQNIINGSVQYIAAKQKNKKAVSIHVPLMDKALTIIARYDLPDGKLLPTYSMAHIETLLKEIFREVGLTRLVTIPDKRTGLDLQVPICSIASTHMARRVFIGALHKQGVKNEIIASMSGHSKNSRAFSRYYDVDEEDQIKALKLIQ